MLRVTQPPPGGNQALNPSSSEAKSRYPPVSAASIHRAEAPQTGSELQPPLVLNTPMPASQHAPCPPVRGPLQPEASPFLLASLWLLQGLPGRDHQVGCFLQGPVAWGLQVRKELYGPAPAAVTPALPPLWTFLCPSKQKVPRAGHPLKPPATSTTLQPQGQWGV